jgi:Tfp pilus assembly protein PilF
VDPAAFEACVLGSYEWKKLTPAGLDAAEHAFEKALAADPSFAPAHSGLAWVWAVRQQMGLVPPSEALPRAKAEALEAARLDPDCAEAHEVLAVILTWGDWDWAGADQEWRRALELNPNAAAVHAYYAHYLVTVGRGAEAWAHSALALELDPFNALFHTLAAVVRYCERKLDEAVTRATRALELQPNHPAALGIIWMTGVPLGRCPEALAALRTYLDLLYSDVGVLAALDEGAAQGETTEAFRRAADALAERHRKQWALPVDIAFLYAMAGDDDPTLAWLERAHELRDPSLPYLCMPVFDVVRSKPRFRALEQRMSLPVSGVAQGG